MLSNPGIYANSLQPLTNGDTKPDSDFEDEIIVTRQEEERDPDAEADFDRELAKMMAESLDSRKFDRKPMFDVPLPMRRAPASTAGEDSPNEGTSTPPSTMAFSLMTKKGNRLQVCSPRIFPILITGTEIFETDSNDRDAFGLAICGCNEEPEGGRTRRAAAHKKPRLELRSARHKRRPNRYRQWPLLELLLPTKPQHPSCFCVYKYSQHSI